MNKIGFIEWLQAGLKERNMSQADLARETNISTAHISRIISGEQSPGIDNIVSIARAIRKRPEEAFQVLAGLTKKEQEYVPFLDDWENVFYELSEEDRQEMLDIARVKLDRKKKTGTSKTKTSRGKKPARNALMES